MTAATPSVSPTTLRRTTRPSPTNSTGVRVMVRGSSTVKAKGISGSRRAGVVRSKPLPLIFTVLASASPGRPHRSFQRIWATSSNGIRALDRCSWLIRSLAGDYTPIAIRYQLYCAALSPQQPISGAALARFPPSQRWTSSCYPGEPAANLALFQRTDHQGCGREVQGRKRMKLGELAKRLGCALEGTADVEITGVTGMDEAGESEVTFFSNPKYQAKLETTRAAAIIVALDVQAPGRTLLRSGNPYLAFAHALEVFAPPSRPQSGIHPTAVIAPGAKLGRNPSIGPYVVIEDGVRLGDDCVLKSFVMIYHGAAIGDRFLAHSHAVVRERTRIGNDVVLQNGAVIGADGFGFAKQADGSYYKIVPSGVVVIEDGVEVQAHSCIDRPSVGETRLRRGVKVDNLVQVGHGCDVGEDTLLCSQVGLAGTSKVGRQVVLTGQVGVAGHLTIGDHAIVTPQSGVPNDVAPHTVVSGSPAIDHARWLKCVALYARLPEIYATCRKAESFLESKGGRE